MKKSFLLFAFLFSILGFVFGQAGEKYSKIDSIKKRGKENLDISLKGLQLLCNYYERTFQVDSFNIAIKQYAKKAIAEKDQKHISNSLFMKSLSFAKQNKLDSALFYFKLIARQPNHRVSIKQNAINNIAECYRIMGDEDSTLFYQKMALQNAKNMDYETGILLSYFSLMKYFKKNGDYKKEIAYLDSTYQYINSNYSSLNKSKSFNRILVSVLMTLGENAYNLKDYELARGYFVKSRDSSIAHNQIYTLLYVNNFLSDYFIKINKPDSALYYLAENFSHPSFGKNDDIAALTYTSYGKLEALKGNYELALQYYDKALALTKKQSLNFSKLIWDKAKALFMLQRISDANDLLNSISIETVQSNLEFGNDYYQLKYQVLSALGNNDLAIVYMEKYIASKDSLFSDYKTKTKISLQTKFETQQKEIEILKLTTENIKKEAQLTQSRYAVYSVVGLLLLIVGLGYFLWTKQKHKQKLAVIESSVKAIENEKNRIGKELHDGIAGSILKIVYETDNEQIGLSDKLLKTYNQVRDLSHQLDGTAIHGEMFFERLLETIPENKEDQIFDIRLSPNYMELQEPYGTHVYRIVQELITNNLKHAKASKTKINIELENDILSISYTDNGVGMAGFKKGNGYVNMEDRIELMNGNMNFNTKQNTGLELIINIPYDNNNHNIKV